MNITQEFPELSSFFSSCFPNNNVQTDAIKHIEQADAIANTLPREGVQYFRHPTTQAGIVMKEDGSIEVRCGHPTDPYSPGSAIVLNPNGIITLLAPNGLMFSGRAVYFPKKATDSFIFDHGSTAIDPLWETQRVAYLNPALPPQTMVMILPPGASVPVPIPLDVLILEELLYTNVSTLSTNTTGQ